MPQGLDLTFNFDTTILPTGGNSYDFVLPACPYNLSVYPGSYNIDFCTTGDIITYSYDIDFTRCTGYTPPTADFDLTECTPSSNLDLMCCGYSTTVPIQPPLDLGFVDAYHGARGDTDLTVTPHFSGIAYHGSNLYPYLTPYRFFEPNAYHGAYGNADLTINPFDQIDSDAWHGAYADADFSTFVVFDVIFEHGAYADADFSTFPPALLEPNAYHGATNDAVLIRYPQFSTDNYHGSYADTDFTTFPPAELDSDAYHGSYADVTLDTFIQFDAPIEHGSYGDTDLTIVLGAGMEADAYHGSYADADTATTYALYPTAYHGARGDLTLSTLDVFFLNSFYHGARGAADFTTVLGQGLEPVAYHGATFEAFEVKTQEAAHFYPMPIIAGYAMYDGMDNFALCELQFVDVQYQDNVIRFDWDDFVNGTDHLLTRFDEVGEDMWKDCPSKGVVVLEINLSCAPRFKATAYEGARAKASIPYEYSEFTYGQIPQMEHGSFGRFAFAPEFYTRFCKGYIRPVGNNVVFDFASVEDTTCSTVNAWSGQNMYSVLQSFKNFSVDYYYDGRMTAYLTTIVAEAWLARGGENMYAYLGTIFSPVTPAYEGATLNITLYAPPIIANHGCNMYIDALSIPGADVGWESSSGCLDNEYIPITPDGDFDFEAAKDIPKIPTEKIPFKHTLVAKCVSYVEEQ